MTTYEPIVFQSAFEKWFKQCAELYADDGRSNLGYSLEYKFGRKYIKIINCTKNQRGAWAFVELETGNIYKPAHWKRPETNHARGNIFDSDGGMKYITWTGPMYVDSINAIKEEEDIWRGADDPVNYPDFGVDVDSIPDGELNEARVTRKSLRQYPYELLTNLTE